MTTEHNVITDGMQSRMEPVGRFVKIWNIWYLALVSFKSTRLNIVLAVWQLFVNAIQHSHNQNTSKLLNQHSTQALPWQWVLLSLLYPWGHVEPKSSTIVWYFPASEWEKTENYYPVLWAKLSHRVRSQYALCTSVWETNIHLFSFHFSWFIFSKNAFIQLKDWSHMVIFLSV